MKNKLLLIITLMVFCSCSLNEWNFRAELPSDASNIKEFAYADMDYTYYLKADISRVQFEDYISHFKMNLHSDTSTYSDDINWLTTKSTFIHEVSSWWNRSLKKTPCMLLRKETNG